VTWLFWGTAAGALVLALLGGLHVYWAAGGRLGIDVVIPERDGQPLLSPSRGMTLLVAALLLAGSGCLLARVGVVGRELSLGLTEWGTRLMAGAFALRAIGDFRYVGFFKRVGGSRFALWDTRLFSPLCVLLFLSCVMALLSRRP
jgi:Protein of unknown function (DUF3995)